MPERTDRTGGARPGVSGRPRDQGQMMLLAAVVLLVGFVALSTLVARVPQFVERTESQGADPLLEEAGTLSRRIIVLLEDLDAAGTADFTADADAVLAHLEVIERSRGFTARLGLSCIASDVEVTVALGDGTGTVSFLVQTTVSGC